MDRREQRKQKKAKAREKELRAQKESERISKSLVQRCAQYPSIRVEGTGKNEEFLMALKDAIKQIDFDNKAEFSSLERDYYRMCKKDGARVAHAVLESTIADIRDIKAKLAYSIFSRVVNNVGERIFQRISEELRQKSFPYVNCQVLPSGQEIVVLYSELNSYSGEGGRIYTSNLEPEISFEGRSYKVAFSRHAIDRICERMKQERISYGATGDIYGFFAKCVYFEPVMLYGDQPAFLMYDYAAFPGAGQYEVYVKQIKGELELDWDGGIPYYRLGYCPVVFENGFAKAKSFLTPGYKGTPEYGLLVRDRTLSYSEKAKLEKLIEDTTSIDMLISGNIDHIKWFHENGIPQVVQMEREVFRYSDNGKKSWRISSFPPLLDRKNEIMDLLTIKNTLEGKA